ncbi:MAG: ABC transporter permease [Bryobacteraceae bacterium]|jgi:predicted permease
MWKNLWFGLRVLRGNPAFAAVAIVTLGLGIAANTTVFGWIDTVLLRPIPGVRDAQQLAALEGVAPDGARLGQMPHPDFRDFERQMTLASGVVASHFGFFTIGPPDHPQRVLGQVVSANFFSVLGVKPFLGRMLLPQEDRDTQGAYPYAVISHRFWRTYFRGNAAAVGRTVRINGHQYTLVGVAPPDFAGTWGGAAFDVWVPLSMIIQTGTLNTWAASDRNARFLDVLLRLKPGVTVEQARQEARAVAARMAAAYPDTHQGIGANIFPMWQASYGLQSALRNPLRILAAVCVLVLLIACANVSNLLMARSVSRRREFGIRIALGASRGQLVRQLLTEAMGLAAAGALGGVLLAQWMGESLFCVFPSLDSTVRAAADPLLHPQANGTVLLFAVLIATGAALLATILPALYAGRVDVNETLKESARGGSPGTRSHRARGALVIAEVALAAMALIGAGLAVRTFQKLARVNLGFEPRGVLVAHFYLSTNGYSLNQEKQFCRTLRLRLEATPGIDQVSYGDSVPLSIFGAPTDRVQDFGSEADQSGVIALPRSIVAPGYFSLMHIPLLEGRDFTERDDLNAETVIIVNQTLARKYFGGRDAVGRKVRVSGKWARVAGVARDSKYRSPAEGPTAYFYGSFGQMFWSGHNNMFYIRARDLDAARATLRREVAALDPNKGLYDLATLADYTQAGLFGERIAAGLLSALGLLALALAAAGLYSVMAYAVSERTHEIGIRMALGAGRGGVLGMVLRQGLVMTMTGLAAGMAATVVIARVLSGALDSPVSIAEPAVFAAAALCLILVALLASYLPARRTTKIDPMIALRAE